MRRIAFPSAVRRLGHAAILGLGLALAGQPVQAADLVISNWDGYMPPDIAERFKAATGLDVEISVHGTNEEIMGKLTASGGKGYDLVFVSSPFVEALHRLGLAAPLDHAKLPNLKNLYPEALRLAYDPGNRVSVPYAWGTTGLCYRTDLVEGKPDSWRTLLSPPKALEGKVTMLSTDRWLLGAGLLANGWSVNETDAGRIQKARDDLIAAKKHLLAYDDTTFTSKLVSGEAALAHAWDGWCNQGVTQNPNVTFVVPKEGSDLWVDSMVVLASSPNKDAAHAFINFILDAPNHAWAAQNIYYKVPNKAAMDSLPPEFLKQFPNIAMPVSELVAMEQLRDLGAAQRTHARAISEIMAAR